MISWMSWPARTEATRDRIELAGRGAFSGRAARCPDDYRRRDESERCTSRVGTAWKRRHLHSYDSSPSYSPPCYELSLRSVSDQVLPWINLRKSRTGFNSTLCRSIRFLLPITPSADRRRGRTSLASGSHYRRATDSRAHLPMSAEPFLVSDHVRRMSRAFQNTQRARTSNLDLSGDRRRASARRQRRFGIFYRSLTNVLMTRGELREAAA